VKLRTTLIACLTIGLFAWFVRDADPAGVWMHVRRARLDMLVLAGVCVAATYWSRTVRWQQLLTPVGPTRFRTAFRATVIGFAALGVLPARAGDVLRPYLLARQEGLSASATMATVVMERVVDLLVVLMLMAVYVYGFTDDATLPAHLRRPLEVSAAVGGIAAVSLMCLLWVMASHPERIGRTVLLTSRFLPHHLADRLARLASTFSTGLAVVREPKTLALAVAWSFAVWIFGSAEAWAVTRAFAIDMPFAGSFLLQAFLVLGIAVPTPGGVGSFHEAYRWCVVTIFHAPNDRAVAAAIVLHALSFGPVILLGALFMAQDGLSVGRLKEMAGTPAEEGAAPVQ
jgi:uncharacterized protein (TIRG00374 family)